MPFRPPCVLILSAALLLLPKVIRGEEKQPPGSVATCMSVAGTLLAHENGTWKVVKAGAGIAPGAMLVSLPRTEIRSANKAVELDLLADIGHHGPFPVLEAAVMVHANPKVDLEVSLDRGIMTLANLKAKGEATVLLHVAGATWNLTLKEPGTRVGLELFGRHPPGAPKILEGKVEGPTTDLIMLVLKGTATLRTPTQELGLHAPPGPAWIHWDNVLNHVKVEQKDKIPEAVTKELNNKESQTYKDVCHCVGGLGAQPVARQLTAMTQAKAKIDRNVAVTLLGGIDDLPGVLNALADAKHADLRNHTVLVLRNWMGRSPGQVEKLHQALNQDGRYSKVHARTILQLLFGFHEEDRQRADTYELLIALLGHNQVPVRELARWHLVRLVPEGKEIPFDAGAPEAQRTRAVAQWQALIPTGQLPPRPKVQPENK